MIFSSQLDGHQVIVQTWKTFTAENTHEKSKSVNIHTIL